MVRECNPDYLQLCVEIAFLRNNQPENNSAYCPKSKKGIQADFEFIMGNPNCLMVGYFDSDTLKGIMGCFMNPDNKWVDCVGPYFSDEYSEDAVVNMFDFAKSKLANAERFNFNFDTRNENLHQLMGLLSAKRNDNEYRLLLSKADYKPQQLMHNVVSYNDRFESDVIQILHDTFPDSYISGRELIDSIGKDREVFCALNDNDVFVGYGVLKRHEAHPEQMTAEIFAVHEGERGKGYGWALLNAVVGCALNNLGADTIDLIVDRLNTHARDLYYSCGFKLIVENSAYCIMNKSSQGGEYADKYTCLKTLSEKCNVY